MLFLSKWKMFKNFLITKIYLVILSKYCLICSFESLASACLSGLLIAFGLFQGVSPKSACVTDWVDRNSDI